MKRTLFIVAVLVAFATAAGAATLTVVADKLSYNPGETITLTITGDDAGASDTGIFGQLTYDPSITANTRAQTQLVGQYGKWTTGVLNTTSGASYAFSQISGTYAQTANNLPGTLSTVTLIAGAVTGLQSVNWDTSNVNPALRLDFFGLTNAAGTSFTIVPEPTTVALLGIGLLGLALGGRRRS